MYNFLLVMVTIVWGSTFFIIKDAVLSINQFFIVFGRMFLACIPILVFALKGNRKAILDIKSIIRGSILGLLLTTTYLSQTIGLKYTSSGHSAFITGIGVILVPIILFVIFKEKILKSDFFSIIIVFIGLFILTYDFETKFNIGDLITFITAFSLAFHIILSGKFVKKVDSIALITYQFLSGSIFSFIGLLFVDYKFTDVPLKYVSAILYLGLIGTLFCYFIFVWIQKYVSSIKVALYFSLEPVFAAIFGYLFLRETLSFKEIFGMTLMFSGVILYQLFRMDFFSLRKLKLKEERIF